MVVQIASVVFGGTGNAVIQVEDSLASDIIVQIHNPEVSITPAALVASVSEALGPEDVEFIVQGAEVLRYAPDSTGALVLVSVPLPPMVAGNFTLTVQQGSNTGSAPFMIVNPFTPPPARTGPDAPPVQVPGSIQPNGTRRWVLQDLMPGGLGSWVMPMNPISMGSPVFNRELTAKTTTASVEQGGQFHISEDAFTPVPWEFNGYAPTKAMRDQLEAFHALNRRWYLHDHRGRAWKVVFQDLSLEARLTQQWNGEWTNEGHDYTATVLVLEREWTAV